MHDLFTLLLWIILEGCIGWFYFILFYFILFYICYKYVLEKNMVERATWWVPPGPRVYWLRSRV